MKKLLLILLLIYSISITAQEIDVETVKEFETERQLAQWIESMLYPIVGESIVIANLTLEYPASRLQLYGSTLDRKKSLPGLPIARSKSVLPTTIDDQETYPTIISKKEITIYLKKDTTEEVMEFLKQNISLWINIRSERGDLLLIKNVMDLNSGITSEAEERRVDNFLFLYLAIALLIAILIASVIIGNGFGKISKAMKKINVSGFEKSIQLKGDLVSKMNHITGKDNHAFSPSANKPLPIQIMKKNEDSDKYNFDFIENLSISNFSKLVENESEENIAFILSNLNSHYTGELLKSYPGATEEILRAMLSGKKRPIPEIVALRKDLFDKYQKLIETEKFNLDSEVKLINVLNQLDQIEVEKYLNQINIIDKEAGERIKQDVFIFSDIIKLNEHQTERVVLNTEHDFLVAFLMSIEHNLKDKFLKSLTTRAANIILEDIKYIGSIEDSEQKIIRFQMLMNIRKILNYIED